MDKLVIPQDATGFPEVIESWEFMNGMVQMPIDGLGHLVGDKCILKGVERQGEVGNISYTDGIITYGGEIMPFIGGFEEAKVSIIVETENANYNTDINDDEVFDNLPAYERRYAKMGDIPGAVATFNFRDLRILYRMDKNLVSHHRNGVYLGNISPSVSRDGLIIDIVFPPVPTLTYIVLPNFRLSIGVTISDKDIDYAIRSRTTSSFELVLRTQTTDLVGVLFEYHIVSTSIGVTSAYAEVP